MLGSGVRVPSAAPRLAVPRRDGLPGRDPLPTSRLLAPRLPPAARPPEWAGSTDGWNPASRRPTWRRRGLSLARPSVGRGRTARRRHRLVRLGPERRRRAEPDAAKRRAKPGVSAKGAGAVGAAGPAGSASLARSGRYASGRPSVASSVGSISRARMVRRRVPAKEATGRVGRSGGRAFRPSDARHGRERGRVSGRARAPRAGGRPGRATLARRLAAKRRAARSCRERADRSCQRRRRLGLRRPHPPADAACPGYPSGCISRHAWREPRPRRRRRRADSLRRRSPAPRGTDRAGRR